MIGILTLPDTFHLEIEAEVLGHSIIPAVPFAAHAANEAVPRQQILVGLAGILTAPIRMDDQALFLDHPNLFQLHARFEYLTLSCCHTLTPQMVHFPPIEVSGQIRPLHFSPQYTR